MLFNTFEFIALFLPIVFIVYYLLAPKTPQGAKTWLFLASIFFYGYWNPIYVILLLGSMAINFALGKYISLNIGNKNGKSLFITGVVLNLGLLGYFKYANFLIENLNHLAQLDFNTINVILPLAISFFTFQQIAFLSDSYKGHTKDYNFFQYGLFVSFFPQLIAGPIVHHEEMMPQFKDEEISKGINYENVSKGLYVFFIGLCKKVVIADTFAVIANSGFGNAQNLTFADSWLTSIAYSIQLYFDFSGYSDMAIGIALLFNVKLPLNFNSPYRALNIQDFWRRWHMTLSRFLRDYLYIPLGGNRKGELFTLRNLFLTFLLGGIWHGAGWTFVMWGALHGGALIIHRMWQKTGVKLPNIISILLTLNFVNVAWVYFRATSFADANAILASMFGFSGVDVTLSVFSDVFALPLLLAGIVLLFLKNTQELLDAFQFNAKHVWYTVSLIFLGLLFINSTTVSEFLYFDF